MIDTTEIASTIINGLSLSGFTIEKAFFLANGPTRKKSRINARGPMMRSSWKALKNTSFFIPPMFSAIL